LLEHYKNKNWGFYTNTRFKMAEILRKERRLKAALYIYLEICYIDLNGPTNSMGRSPELLKQYPSFDNLSFLADAIVGITQNVIEETGTSKEEVKTIFLTYNARIQKSLQTPRTPEQCWPLLEQEIWKK